MVREARCESSVWGRYILKDIYFERSKPASSSCLSSGCLWTWSSKSSCLVFDKGHTNVEKGQVLVGFSWSWVRLRVGGSPARICVGIPEDPQLALSCGCHLCSGLRDLSCWVGGVWLMPCCRFSPACASSTPSSPSPAAPASLTRAWILCQGKVNLQEHFILIDVEN